ncbi:hypothetical protein PITCH_A1200003 [uncultured Desulfobacterium sp.]|uniref:Uncharacterized protein n=1 Tax=uncultured Desulfobacterium sp. TaxID=201089 RepID=A0A445MRR3_9BACT|nr:hypothetical protein PITCH_A1200003 [uncultured Desulfobacterium sp.]
MLGVFALDLSDIYFFTKKWKTITYISVVNFFIYATVLAFILAELFEILG